MEKKIQILQGQRMLMIFLKNLARISGEKKNYTYQSNPCFLEWKSWWKLSFRICLYSRLCRSESPDVIRAVLRQCAGASRSHRNSPGWGCAEGGGSSRPCLSIASLPCPKLRSPALTVCRRALSYAWAPLLCGTPDARPVTNSTFPSGLGQKFQISTLCSAPLLASRFFKFEL